MQELPHYYHATASAAADSHVEMASGDFPQIIAAPPVEFGGPGDQWSPEHLLVGTVANCFILTFRAIAAASRLEWIDLECSAEGTLERVDRITKFTAFTITAKLRVGAGTDPDKAQKLMEKAEAGCLITNSLSAGSHLDAEVVVDS